MGYKNSDITVSFGGHNIKHFVVLAVKSFIYFYPELKDNIIYFDDESTDGTQGELEKLGVRVITWNNHYTKVMEEVYKHSGMIENSIRASLSNIIITENCKTKYLCMFDGDVIFKRRGIIEHLFNKKTEESVGCFEIERFIGVMDNETRVKIKKEIMEDLVKYTKLEIIEKSIRANRFYMYSCLIDIENIHKYDIKVDYDEMDFLINLNGNFYDTGSGFFIEAEKRGINYDKITYHSCLRYLNHFHWGSSLMMDIEVYDVDSKKYSSVCGNLVLSLEDKIMMFLEINDELETYMQRELRKFKVKVNQVEQSRVEHVRNIKNMPGHSTN